MKNIDLNCDMGESFGAYQLGMDKEAIKHITSANIACGWHAGDPLVMDRTVKMAKDLGVGIGAHPGYPDLLGFGRRNMKCTLREIKQYVIYQLGALQAFCQVHGTKMVHVKPHGALYLEAVENEAVARAIAESILSFDSNLFFVALAGKKGEVMSHVGEKLGLRVVYEAFPDRAYTSNGTLVSRHEPGAVITDPGKVSLRALDMAKNGMVIARDGSEIKLSVHTLCVHGDTPTSVELVKNIRKVLKKNSIQVVPLGDN